MNKFALSLSGFGNLIETQRISKGILIKIKVFSGSSDDIELECTVNKPDLIEQLDNLLLECRADEHVVLQFIVHYTQFLHCHTGLTKQDPKHMVQLKGTLISFHGQLRSNDLPPATSAHDL